MDTTKPSALRELAERKAKEFVKIGFRIIGQLSSETKSRVSKANLWRGLENKVFKLALEAEDKYGLPSEESISYIGEGISHFLSFRGLLNIPETKIKAERRLVLSNLRLTEFSSKTGTNYRFGIEEIDRMAAYLNGCIKILPRWAKYLLIQGGEFQDLLNEVCLVAMEQWIEGKSFDIELMNDLWANTLFRFGRNYGIRIMERIGEERLGRLERRKQGLVLKRAPGLAPAAVRNCAELAVRRIEESQQPLYIARNSIEGDPKQGVKTLRKELKEKRVRTRIFRFVLGGCTAVDAKSNQLITLMEGKVLPNLNGRVPSRLDPEPIDKDAAISVIRELGGSGMGGFLPVIPFGEWRAAKPEKTITYPRKHDYELILNLHQQGYRYSEIAEKANCNVGRVCQIIRKLRKRHRDASPSRHNSRERKYDYELIEQLYDGECSVREITEKVNAPRSGIICNILQRIKREAFGYSVDAVVKKIKSSQHLLFVTHYPLGGNVVQSVKTIRKKLTTERKVRESPSSVLGGCTIVDVKNSQLLEILECGAALDPKLNPLDKETAVAAVYEVCKSRDSHPRVPGVLFLKNFGEWRREKRVSER